MSPRVRMILNDVAGAHKVTVDDILGRSRLRPISTARREAMRRVRALHSTRQDAFTFPALGRLFGRDHTTVIDACRP